MSSLAWTGYTDDRFGYGSMYWGLRNNLPAGTVVDPKGGVSIHVGVPCGVKGWFEGQYRTV